MAQTRPLADVIAEAAGRAGGGTFTLGWLMRQPGVRDAIPSEHRVLDILQQLTDEGRLLGHLVIGERMLSERSGMLDSERRLALLHCVLCHHGPAGAPAGRFQSAEALALCRLNALDADIKGAFEHGLGGSR